MIQRGESIRVMHPLFHEGDGGSTPTSPLQLLFGRIDARLARDLVGAWHSRLPEITNWQVCSHCFGAEHGGLWYASAMWGPPIAREYNGRGFAELRRFAIAPDAPKNTASRMLAWMVREIRKDGFSRAISYQDTEAHAGTIYKASGWVIGGEKKNIGTGWNTRPRNVMQTTSNKVRWELDL